MTGSGSKNRIITITELGIKLGQEKCLAILGLHIFTGCDNIRTFKGKGKTKLFRLILESEAFCSAYIDEYMNNNNIYLYPLAVVGKSLMTFFLMWKSLCALCMGRKILIVVMRKGTAYFD